MKPLVYAIVAAIIVTACGGVKIQQHNLPCHSRGKTEIIQAATALLVQQGLKITMADTLVVLVQAESEEQRDVWSGMHIKRYWQVSVRPTIGPLGEVKPADQESLSKPKHPKPMFIIATAKTTTQSKNAFGATAAGNGIGACSTVWSPYAMRR